MVVLALSLTHRLRQCFKTALMFAVEEGKKSKVVRVLLERKANINAQDTKVTVTVRATAKDTVTVGVSQF